MKTLAIILLLLLMETTLGLKTSGRWIVDNSGARVKLACVNWYGTDQKDFAVGGLEQQSINFIAKLIKDLGFNCVRLPWSLQVYETNPLLNNRTKLAANLGLVGSTALKVLDLVIDSLASNGIMIVLDNHLSVSDWCCSNSDGNGLWYTTQYPESNWISAWTGIVKRYLQQPMVVGADLRNELRQGCVNNVCRSPVWGGGDPMSDWHAAAERCGNAVLGVNPDLLIFVEGTNYALDLTGVAKLPITLNVANRVVYSAHNYEWDFGLSTYAQFKQRLDHDWGYIITENQPYTAPLWLGEFGTCNNAATCVDDNNGQGMWFQWLIRYINETEISWGYWAVDGTQSSGTGRQYNAPEGYGILNTQWSAPALKPMIDALKTIQ